MIPRNLSIQSLRSVPAAKIAYVELPSGLQVQQCEIVNIPHMPHLHLGSTPIQDTEYAISSSLICPGMDSMRQWREYKADINPRIRHLAAQYAVTGGKAIFGLPLTGSFSYLPLSIRRLTPEAAAALAAAKEGDSVIDFSDAAITDSSGPEDVGLVTLEAPDAVITAGDQKEVVIAGKIKFPTGVFENGEKTMKFAPHFRISAALLRFFRTHATLTRYMIVDWHVPKYEVDDVNFAELSELAPQAPDPSASAASTLAKEKAQARAAAQKLKRTKRGNPQTSRGLAQKRDVVTEPPGTSPVDDAAQAAIANRKAKKKPTTDTEASGDGSDDERAEALAKSRAARKNSDR